MRDLTPALIGAINSSSRRPAVRLTLADAAESYALFRDDGGALAESVGAAVVAADGSLMRAYAARAPAAGGGSLFVQRVSDVSQDGQWTAWTLLEAGNVWWATPPALSLNPGGRLRLFFADGPSAGDSVRVRESLDGGASWSPASTVFAGVGTAAFLASAGNDDLFAQVEQAPGSWQVAASFHGGGGWSAPAAWSLGGFSSMYGLGAVFEAGIYHLVLSLWTVVGVAGAGDSLQSTTFDGATWTPLATVVPLDSADLGIQLRFPSLAFFDGRYRLAYVEHDDGSVIQAPYDRARLMASADFLHWDERPPLGPTPMAYSPAWLSAQRSRWVAGHTRVWRWPLYTEGDTTRTTDLSGFVLSYHRREAAGQPGLLEVVLSTQGGGLRSAPGLKRGGRLTLNEGYLVGGAPEMATVGTYWIEEWSCERSPGRDELTIVARDGAAKLERQASQQWLYQGQTLGWLLAEVASHAGLRALSLPAGPQFAEVVERFTILAGERWEVVLRRLLGLYGAVARVDASGALVVLQPASGDAPAWSYAGEMERLRWRSALPAANHVRVFGKGAQAEARDWAAIAESGREDYLQVVDRQLGSPAQCALRAGQVLAAAGRGALGGAIAVPLNPGPELYDVLTASDPGGPGGLPNGQRYRVLALRASFDVRRATYAMELDLEGV